MIAALAAARELPQLSLHDALELTLLVAREDPRRHPRVAARWLQRYLEDPAAPIEEAGLAASALITLTGAGYQEAVQTLRAMAGFYWIFYCGCRADVQRSGRRAEAPGAATQPDIARPCTLQNCYAPVTEIPPWRSSMARQASTKEGASLE